MNDTLDTTSYWQKTAVRRQYSTPKGDTETETLIIGGGITGVTCAYLLGKEGKDAVLIEADRLCGGTTGNTTGKATIQHGILYSRMIRTMGRDAASEYARAQNQALSFIRDFSANRPECCYREDTAYLFGKTDKEIGYIEDEFEAAKAIGIEAERTESPPFPPESRLLLGFPHQGVIHPVGYVEELAKQAEKSGVKLYEHTKAVRVEGGEPIVVTCESGLKFRAKYVILATQYPIYEEMKAFFARLYPKRTYGIAVRAPKDWPDGSYINVETPSRSIRTHQAKNERVLIVVGDGHYTARSGDMKQHFDELMQYATSLAGFDDLLAQWSAQDYKTPDDLPYIGRISKGSNIFVATGFGKWGITNGTLSALMFRDLITKGESDFEELFSPSRSNFKAGAGTFFGEVSQQVKELVKSKLSMTDGLEEIKKGEGRIIRYEGKRAGAYLDDEGRLTIVDTTCTHLGCEVGWNSAERSWDCPCHGGRYSYDGRLLEGPPPDNLKILYQDTD